MFLLFEQVYVVQVLGRLDRRKGAMICRRHRKIGVRLHKSSYS